MAMVIKTAIEILPLSTEAVQRLDKLKGIKDEDIDTSDMPELTDEQLARMEPARFFEGKAVHAHA
ncbi:hypothetical protein FACS1894137_18860 [Spirochaetia bacterium]|nr:hypothetical protein FACS1894137_18860 [Spirochaetia bacterium]